MHHPKVTDSDGWKILPYSFPYLEFPPTPLAHACQTLQHVQWYQVFLQAELSVHVIFRQLLKSYNNWRQLHEHQPSDTRNWSVLFSFQALRLLLTVLDTAATHVLGKTKDRDSCESDGCAQADGLQKRRRCRSLDGLMVCQQATTVTESYLMIMPSL